MKVESVKLAFVYGNVTFIIVAGFYVLYQVATRPDIPQTDNLTSFAALIGGLLGICVQFLTGSEIAKRADVAANTAFQAGAGSQPTVTTSSGPPPTTTITPPLPPEPPPTT